MATQIKLKRGTNTPTTSDIANGEVAIDTSAKKFYINDNGTIKEIGGGTSSGDSSSPLSGDVRGYTGDGSTVAYTVTSGADVENILVFVNGVFQRPTTDFTVSGTTLTFGTAPANGDAVTIKELVEGQNTYNDNPVVRAYTGDGSTTDYNVTSGKDKDEFLVFINGVFQRPTTDFTVSAGTLTFGTAPVNGDVISIKELAESSGALLTIVDDTSTTTDINQGESLKITGSGGVTTSLSGDTLTISGAAQLTVQDEGSDLTTAASTINFVGSGVTATGSGSTKTITIPGGGGDIFKNIAMPDGSTIVAADSSTDTLTLAQSGLVTVTGDSATDTVTIGTASTAAIPFLKADGSSSNIDLQTSGTIGEVLTNLYIPFTIADGSAVETLVVGSS